MLQNESTYCYVIAIDRVINGTSINSRSKHCTLLFKAQLQCLWGWGYLQANVVILPSSLADEFETFCRANPAPLPLLHRSLPGDWGCLPLASQADVRTDCPQYNVYEQGVLVDRVSSLRPYDQQLEQMVSFYLGCSFSFERSLQAAGVPVRNVQQQRDVSMYRTSLLCAGGRPFQCPLVVSMRPVPADKLDLVAQCTQLCPQAHGAPIHIGDPALLGIQDDRRPTYGDAVEAEPGDVPVFWACGVTGVEAVLSCKPPLAFTTHYSLFITDLPCPSSSSTPPTATPQLVQSPRTFLISQNPLHYSMASVASVQCIRSLETLIGEDPGQRGVQALFVQDELLRSCLSLSHCSSVLLTTGFPTHHTLDPPDETDGPPGALAMAAALQALGKQVTMVTDRRALEMNRAIVEEAARRGVIKTVFPLVTFQSTGPDSALHFLCHDGDPTRPRFDHLVAIERSGRAADGNYYNMRGVNIKHLVDPIDYLFTTASTIPGITTTGIGDGGNELGMGKVREAVWAHMPNGALIACDVPADFAITAGVSNWGGYAVAYGLHVLSRCPVHQRYLHKGLDPTALSPRENQEVEASLPSVVKEEEMLSILVRFGVRSGKTGTLGMEVDGLTFHPTHSDLITRLRDCALARQLYFS